MKLTIEKILRKLRSFGNKSKAESLFWQSELKNYLDWYTGSKEIHFGTPTPHNSDKIVVRNIQDSAILTWHKQHQENKYLLDLILSSDAFEHMKVLDVGSGPMPSATVFKNAEIFCLDPLIGKYIELGFPIHYYKNLKFIARPSENMPFEDNFFDAVISVNAIDHVDDFFKSSMEIQRVLKENGLLRMHVHYHPATQAEPVEITDEIFASAFAWCKNLRIISKSETKMGSIVKKGEQYVVWSNF
jgi:SAM-dependent methyltransferase